MNDMFYANYLRSDYRWAISTCYWLHMRHRMKSMTPSVGAFLYCNITAGEEQHAASRL